MTASVRDQLAQLSLHGIPRVAATNSSSHRAVWLLLFLSASSVFTAHVVKLIQRCSDCPVNTEVKIESVPIQSVPNFEYVSSLKLREHLKNAV